MLVRFSREYDRYGAGFVTEVNDETAAAAIGEGAAEELHRVRLATDWRDRGGQTFAANFEYDLTADQLAAARKAGAVPDEPAGDETDTRPRAARKGKAAETKGEAKHGGEDK